MRSGSASRLIPRSVPWILVLAGIFPRQISPQAPGRAIAPSSSLTVSLAGTEEAELKIGVPEGETLELQVVEQQGDAGLFLMQSAGGNTLATLNQYKARTCARSALVPPGTVLILAKPLTHSAGQRVFEIKTGQLHPVGSEDRLRLAAERLLTEAEGIDRENGDVHAAIADYEKAAAIWMGLPDRSRQSYALLLAGEDEEGAGDMQSALAHTRQALDFWTSSGDTTCRGEALRQLADVQTATGHKREAEESVVSALALSRAAGDAPGTMYGLVIEGGLLEARGEIEKARADFNEALTLAERTGKRVLQCSALTWLGELEYKQGDWKEAVQYDLRSLEIAKADGERAYIALNLNDLGANYRQMADMRAALSYFEQALPLLRDVSQSHYGAGLYNIGTAYMALDDDSTALKYLDEALPVLRKSGNPRGQAFALQALGDVYAGIGDYDRAESYYRQSDEQWRQASEKSGEIFALAATGRMAARRREFSKAIDLYRQALSIAHAAGYQLQEGSTLGALSDAYFSSPDLSASLDAATQRLEVARKIADSQEEGLALYQQGRAWRALRDSPRARQALEQSLAVLQSSGNGVQRANAVYELASIDRDSGELTAGRDRILQALDWLEQVGANAGNSESRMLFAASHRKSFDLAVDIQMRLHQTALAFELAERARARELVDLIRAARLDIREGADPALLARERRVQELLDTKQERLMHLLDSSHSAAEEAQDRQEIGSLLQQYRDIEDEFRRQSPRYAALIEPRPLSLADVQAQLRGSGAALLEFWLGEERSYAWLVTKTGVQGFELPPREQVENAARRAYAALDARNTDRQESLEARAQRLAEADRQFAESATELSKTLLEPLRGLSRLNSLWIVSDGALEYLPFAALPIPGTHTPLVVAHQIVRLPSLSAVREMRSEVASRGPARLSVAVFADPVFRADDERVSNLAVRQASDPPRAASDVDLFHLPRLYFSRQEADAIRELGGQEAREVLDFDATRAAAESPSLRDYRVIHFATHALVDSKNPELSGLVLSMIDRQGRPEDGFLRLHEIYNLKLNADLVVLSACRTALGPQVQSEGLIGLTRGFMYAGAPQVLASLWSIRDNATTSFMQKFYAALLERHESPEAALRSAQLAMIQDPHWNQPYYWAAFTVQGAR